MTENSDKCYYYDIQQYNKIYYTLGEKLTVKHTTWSQLWNAIRGESSTLNASPTRFMFYDLFLGLMPNNIFHIWHESWFCFKQLKISNLLIVRCPYMVIDQNTGGHYWVWMNKRYEYDCKEWHLGTLERSERWCHKIFEVKTQFIQNLYFYNNRGIVMIVRYQIKDQILIIQNPNFITFYLRFNEKK